MRRAMRTRRLMAAMAVGVAAITVPLAGPADAAAVTVSLCATTGSATMPDGVSVPVWGFVPGDCATTGNADLRSNVIRTDDLGATITEGDDVTINLTVDAAIGENVSLIAPTLPGAPDLVGVSSGTTSYTFTNVAAGTHLLESGVNPSTQISMGLYGALVVAPTGPTADVDEVLVLSELDVDLNNDPAGFVRNDYAPEYFLINGRAGADIAPIAAGAGQSILVRYVNAGNRTHSMAVLGTRQTVVAREGRPVPLPRSVVAEMVSPGHTVDVTIDIPSGTPAGASFALYNRNGRVVDDLDGQSAGGMQTSIAIGGAPPVDDDVIYASFQATGEVGGVAYGDEDILAFSNGAWLMFLDFQDTPGTGRNLPAGADVDALKVLGPNHVLVSFAGTTRVFQPDGSRVRYRDVDVVEFDNGTWSLLGAGADLGLTFNTHDVNAFDLLDDGRFLVSTLRDVPGVPTTNGGAGWEQQDLIAVDPVAQTVSIFVNGQDVFGPQVTGGEDINSVAVEPTGGLLLSTFGNHNAPTAGANLRGDRNDVARLQVTTVGVPTVALFEEAHVVDAAAVITEGARAGQPDRLDALAIG